MENIDIKQLNEEIAFVIQDTKAMNEMATIEKQIIVHNDKETGQIDDNLKFAHFHYANIHFKFRKNCPKNISELKEMIAFSYELKRIKDIELSKLLKLLNSKPTRNSRIKADTVYDYVITIWEGLNDREADYID